MNARLNVHADKTHKAPRSHDLGAVHGVAVAEDHTSDDLAAPGDPRATIPAAEEQISFRARIGAHIKIMRLDHSIKNIFVLPGIIVPLSLLRIPLSISLLERIVVGLIATTLIASSNYVINELLDAPFDRLHPAKKCRPAAMRLVSTPAVYVQWISLMIAGMVTASMISVAFAVTAAGLWIMGCVYNIPPLRSKDVAYLDVLSESINNPLRMLLGWYMVTSVLTPPVSLLLSYWMIGCYFMALKRFSEFREIGTKQLAGKYRESFKYYSEQTLLGSVTFYAAISMLFFGAFIMRYHLELIFAFPLVALMMATYFNMAFEPHSAAQHPEKLYKKTWLMIEAGMTAIAIIALLYLRLPFMERMFAPTLPPVHIPGLY